jgi:hypothetical protein
MKLNKMPEEYRRLALRRTTLIKRLMGNDLLALFEWEATPEGFHFWDKCYKAKSLEDLPEIPKYSSIELEKEFV